MCGKHPCQLVLYLSGISFMLQRKRNISASKKYIYKIAILVLVLMNAAKPFSRCNQELLCLHLACVATVKTGLNYWWVELYYEGCSLVPACN